MPYSTQYPTPFWILRNLLKALDFKLNQKDKKNLDKLANQHVYDPREFTNCLENYFLRNAEKYFGDKIANQVYELTSVFFRNYQEVIVGQLNAAYFNRKELLTALITDYFSYVIADLTIALHRNNGGPHPSFWFSANTNIIDSLFSWLEDESNGFENHIKSLKNEHRDVISAWRKGQRLPSAQRIELISHSEETEKTVYEDVNWPKLKLFIFIARIVEHAKTSYSGNLFIEETRVALWMGNLSPNFEASVKEKMINYENQLSIREKTCFDNISRLLKPSKQKKDSLADRGLINELRELTRRKHIFVNHEYWVDWHEAMLCVYSGELQLANDFYKLSFKKAIFNSGLNLKKIIEQALAVAASQNKPDRVFLKQLKWAQIMFSYDLPSVSNKQSSQITCDTVEHWEIDMWKGNFKNEFPPCGLYPGVNQESHNIRIGPLLIRDKDKIKPDYRYPNREIKVGDTWKKTIPQIVWFAEINNVEVCRKLIEKGASINVKSDAGDTPILMALKELNLLKLGSCSFSDELFNLIASQEHDIDIINARTQKKRMLPILSAVSSGRLDIVKKVLDLGADPNGRGHTDEETALNVCMKLILCLKNPKLFKKIQSNISLTKEVLDSIRRHTNGFTGSSLEETNQALFNLKVKDTNNLMKAHCLEKICNNLSSYTNIEELRSIALLLIDKGADVNAEHSSPIKGYTPLMLAAEQNERKLFEKMLVHGGNLNKTYKHPKSNEDISLRKIAEEFNSYDIMRVLDDIATNIKR